MPFSSPGLLFKDLMKIKLHFWAKICHWLGNERPMNHTRRPPVSSSCTHSEAGVRPGLPAGMRRSYRVEERALWGLLYPLRQKRSIHSPMRKFRERNGIKDMDVRNTFFPIELCSLGCRLWGDLEQRQLPGCLDHTSKDWIWPEAPSGSRPMVRTKILRGQPVGVSPHPQVHITLHWVSTAGIRAKVGSGGCAVTAIRF